MDQTNLFSGEWRIQSWVQRYDDGRVEYPMGQQLEGFIRYLPDGRMFCMIARAERSPFVEGGSRLFGRVTPVCQARTPMRSSV